jgi:hypothetical protein
MGVDLYTADLSAIPGTDLHKAIVDFTRSTLPPDDRTPESYTVDFKETWSSRSLRVVAAFANTFGGIIVIGVSEDNGKAKDIAGEASKSELKTRFAGSISSNITPTPDYDIAECEIPGVPDRRLCIIRVRPANRIHFLTIKGESPVYVRNEDQAIPARAAELRSLIDRERDKQDLSIAAKAAADLVLGLLPVDQAEKDIDIGSPAQRRTAASILRLAIVPEQRDRFSLDRNVERTFGQVVRGVFPPYSFRGDFAPWDSLDPVRRRNAYFRIDYTHLQRDIEAKWLFTNSGDFGYATLFSLDGPQNKKAIWSLLDLTAVLVASVRSAHSMLTYKGYLGAAQIDVFVEPAVCELYIENGMLPTLRHASIQVSAWPSTILTFPAEQPNRTVRARASSTFHSRTEGVAQLVAELLNQVLRELEYGTDLAELEQYISNLTKAIPAHI